MIIDLREIGEGDGPRVGGKALSLGRLMRLGLPVPEGFCITSDAWPAGGADAPLEAPLVAALERRWRALGAASVAVRSSASDEDTASRSSAGQYETILNVETFEACLDAIARCRASLLAPRAVAYRRRGGGADRGATMAVIVQRLVPADVSGVLFTVDPLAHGGERIVIEAAPGPGDAIVCGRVQPDRIVLARPGLDVVERHPASRQGTLCIDDATAAQLARLALRAEESFGGPLDVEWAIAGGQAFLLQARPVTVRPAASWEARQVWTNANAAEALPDVMTPMTEALVESALRELFGVMGRWLGLDVGGVEVYRSIAGRPYFNLNSLMGVARCIPALRGRAVDELLGGHHAGAVDLGTIEIAEADIPRVRLSWPRLLMNLPRLALAMVRHNPRRAERFIAALRAENDAAWARHDERWRAMSDEALAVEAAHRLRDLMGGRDLWLYLGVGSGHGLNLFALCRRWFGEEGHRTANRLLAGIGPLEHAESGLALWRLARAVADRPALRRALEAAATFEELRGAAGALEGGREFLADWEAFMLRFGHHARGELELANPRWRERPEHVLSMVRSLLEGIDAGAGRTRAQSLEADGAALAAECRRRLRHPLKRPIFSMVLRLARRGAPVRENLRNEVVRRLVIARSMLLVLGERLAARGLLEVPSDVFFLLPGEIVPLAREGKAVSIAARKAAYERNRRLDPPPVIRGRFDATVPGEAGAADGRRVLRGIAVSPGVARGPARVIVQGSDDHVRPGEVLVAPFTDPAWSPHFLNAAAVVMDMGGLISHGAIVAREYGLPCVVNVGPATSLIRSGRMLLVDGDRGIVEILDE